MNIPQVASSIKFLADFSQKQEIHFSDYYIAYRAYVGADLFLIKSHLQCSFQDFQ